MLSPPKVLGPWIEQWHLDGTKLTYREIVCTGTAARTATGTLEDGPDGKAVRWTDNGEGKADDPWVGNAETETTPLKITDSRRCAHPCTRRRSATPTAQTRAFVRALQGRRRGRRRLPRGRVEVTARREGCPAGSPLLDTHGTHG
jgi:hypothetical protein